VSFLISFSKTSSAIIIALIICSILPSAAGSSAIQSISSPTYPEGSYWTYQSIWESKINGVGTCPGSQTYVEFTEGRVDLKGMNESTILVEDNRDIDLTSSLSGCSCHPTGSGPLYPAGSNHYSLVVSKIIDRKTLSYVFLKVGLEQYASMVGLPATEFVDTSVKEGQFAPYCFKEKKISCNVRYGSLRFEGKEIPVITLHYGGPSNVSIPLIVKGVNARLEGAGDYTFNFEKETGVLISYSIKESTPMLISSRSTTFNMSGCTLTTTNNWNYSLKSASWELGKAPITTTPPPASKSSPERPFIFPEIPYPPFLAETSEKYAMSQWTLTLILVGIAIAGVGVLVLRKFKR